MVFELLSRLRRAPGRLRRRSGLGHAAIELRLDVIDAAELAELLQFLSEWLARDPDRLGISLEAFVGHPAYGTAQLRQDLNRFTFLLGGDDGQSLFGPNTREVG